MFKRSSLQVFGQGLFTERLAERMVSLLPDYALEGPCELPPQLDMPSDIALAVTRLDEVRSVDVLLCQSREVIYVGLWRAFIYIGPYWSKNRKGCPRCLVTRVANSPYGPDMDRNARIIPATYNYDYSSGLAFPPFTLTIVANLVAKVINDFRPGHPPHLATGVFILNTRNNEITFESLLYDSICTICGDQVSSTLPEFTGDKKILEKPDPTTLRIVDTEKIGSILKYLYQSSHVGIVKEIEHDLQSPFASCSLELALRWDYKDAAIGRSNSYQKSRMIAILEALERYAGWHRGGRREIIRASYKSISNYALNPLDLGVHPEACYNLPGYPYTRFSPEMPIDWVWGYSFSSGQPILVPERYAFYGYRPDKETTFVYETSNGCALGSSTEEAIIHGLLELVERDSFLMTWYRKLILPELSTTSLQDKEMRTLLRKVELFTNSRFRVFLSTMEHGIPSVWLTATNYAGTGPCTLASAGAHPDLVQAVKGAIYELTGSVLRLQHSYNEKRSDALSMIDNPHLVRKMEDHALVNCLPEAGERFSFLLDQEADPILFEDACATTWQGSHDLRSDLESLVTRLLRAGLDVIVVDQTMAELRAGGLVCVKVIVPGLLPMAFGHIFRRVEHLPRLLSQTSPSMYKSALRSSSEIGEQPHPFP